MTLEQKMLEAIRNCLHEQMMGDKKVDIDKVSQSCAEVAKEEVIKCIDWLLHSRFSMDDGKEYYDNDTFQTITTTQLYDEFQKQNK